MKTTNFLLTCALFTATAFVGLQPISAKVLYVGTGAQWAGKPTADVHATPNAAFTAAAEGDEIWIAGGTYDITSRFAMTTSGVGKLVSFYGGFAGTENAVGERAKTPNGKGWEFANPTTFKQTGTITSGMFYAWNLTSTTATNFTIDGLILEGYDNNNNCGLYWQSNTPLSELNISVKNCWVKNFGNAGASSGGIRLVEAADPVAYNSFVVDSCLIENNKGGSGGGVYVEGFKTIKNSVIRNNTGTNGGGIYVYTGTPATGAGLTITGCLIEENTATTNGGGIYVRDVGAKHNIQNCIVVNNATTGISTGNGGGVYFGNTGNPVITKISNLTIANNQAYYGAGAYFGKAGVGVYNTIFYNNRDNTTSKTLENIYASSANQPSPFKNNIVDKDYKFPDSSGCVISTNGEAIFGYGWITLPSSSGKDKGTADVGENLTLPAIDYAGNARIQGDAIDIGPYECAPITDNTPPTAPENLTLKSTGKTTLTLEWSKSADDVLLKGYSISVNGGAPNILTTASLDASYSNLEKVCYQLTGLAENTQYSVSVQAIDWADNLSTAATGSFSTTNADDPAKIWYVGSGWQGKPFNRLKATPTDAYTAAAAGNEIWIAGGTYNVTSRFTLTSKLVSFYGGFAGTENSIGERAKTPNGKGWEFAHPTILKQAVSLTTAMFYAYSPAAAAHANASTISINGLTLDGNSRYNNGGIYWRTGTALPTLNVSIKNCTVQNFGATGTPVAGGGLSIIGTGAYASFVVDSCLIENNTGSSGGGVNVEGEKTIRSSAILNNTATGSGGGIYIYTGTAATGAGLTITGCLIEGNTAAAANGGGIYVVDVGTKHNIHNCIVVNNSATTNGGGVYFGSTGTSIAKISNLTIANNRAGSGAGAYFAKAGVGVYNTIFYNNRNTLSALENIYYGTRYPAPFSNNIIDKEYSDLTMTSCIVSADSAAIFGENWATALTSIGMDKGTAAVGGNFTLPNVDYTGKARQVGAIDIGPYEIFHAPANLSGIPGGSVVGLTWSAVPGATSYNIYADAGSLEVATTLIATSTTPYYRATGLTPESPYTFTVKAPIEPALWATVQVTTLNASTPDSPDGLTVSAATESSVSLSWTLPANAAGISKYIVYANGVAVDSTADADVTSITVAGLLPWREYSFTVRSKSSANGVLSAPTNPSTTRTADNTAPSATVATLKSATKTTLTVEWSASVDAGALAGYIIYVDSSAVDTITLSSIDDDILSLMNGKFTYAITGRTASTEYSVGVRAYDEAGNFSEQAATNLSTTDADEPLIWYVGKWIGKPADYILPTVNAAYTEIAAVTGAQLWIQGEHNLSERITLSGKNVNSISLYGGFAGYENDPSERARAAGGKGWEFSYPTTLKIGSGSAIYSSVTNPPLGSIVIDGLRLEGVSAGNSRGIYWGSNSATDSVAIRNCVIQNFGGDSSTYNGGGIQLGGEAKHKSFVVEDCLIRNNKALNGGGIHMDGHRTIRNCEIRGNSVIGRSESVAPEDSAEAVAGAGGGVYVYKADGISSITGCLIEGNRAYSGGGLYLRHVSDSAAVGSNVVVNNTAVYGGGVAFSGDTTTSTTALKITNFTIASNRADQRGGGVYFADSGQQVYNTILWNNRTATASGDTTDNVYANPLANDLTFSHNIVDREYEYANLAQVGCITESDSAKLFGAGWVTAFPSAAEDGGFDIASAPATSIPATDMLGQPRTVGGGIDIGPYERQAEAGAPSIPQNLDGTPEGASDILLTWQPSTPAGGDAIAGYLIYLNRVLVDTVPAPDTSYTATELTSGDYAIQVAALSSAGKVSPKTPLGNVITLMEGAAYVVKIISVGEGVAITSPSNLTSTVSMGDSLTITFTLDGAYENPVVTANAAPVSCVLTDAGYVAVIKSTINVKVSIAASLKPTVTLTVDESIVIISPSGLSHTVETNSSFSIQFNLRQGYANPVVTVNGSNVDPTFSGGVYNVSITITENTTVSLSASPAPVTGIEDNVWDNDYVVATIYYNLLGQEVRTPAVSGIYFVKETYASKKTVVRKKLIIVR